MRGKKAKALRRRAEGLSVGDKHTAYMRKSNSTLMQAKRPSLVLKPGCTRAVYQQLKKQVKP